MAEKKDQPLVLVDNLEAAAWATVYASDAWKHVSSTVGNQRAYVADQCVLELRKRRGPVGVQGA